MLHRILRLAIVLLPAVATLIAQSSGDTFRVMTYNIHHGEGLDGRVDLERIARLITNAGADLVGLQEVDRGCERTQKRDLPAELAKLTGMHVHFEKNIDYQGGEYGNAVLTKFPIKSAKNTHFEMLRPGEQRGVLQLVLDVRGRDVLFLNTHLNYGADDAERLSNARELKQMVAAAGTMPVILCGDFNARPESRTIEEFATFLTDAWTLAGTGNGYTIPVTKPARRIDYIWISKESIVPQKLEVLHSEASDHLPIVAALRLR